MEPVIFKKCSHCEQNLILSAFSTEAGHTRNVCNNCRLLQTRASRELRKNKEKVTVTEKQCSKCNKTKSASEFYKKSLNIDNLDNNCIACRKKNRKKKITVEHIPDGNQLCQLCKTLKSFTNFRTYSRSKSGFYKTCNDCWAPTKWNKEKQKESEKKYVKNNPDKMRQKWQRASKNPNRIIRNRLNKRIIDALNSQRTNKNNKTVTYIGCDIKFLRNWIEYQFTDVINWNTYGNWHIDHVKPCASFDLTDEKQQLLCFNWSNLRPCLAEENMRKNDKIDDNLIKTHKELASKFLESNPLPN